MKRLLLMTLIIAGVAGFALTGVGAAQEDWELEEEKNLDNTVRAVAYSDEYLAATNGTEIHVYDADTGNHVEEIPTDLPNDSLETIETLEFSEDGSKLGYTTNGGRFKILETNTWTVDLSEDKSVIYGLDFAPNDRVAYGDDSDAIISDQSGNVVYQHPTDGRILSVDFAPDNRVAFGADNGEIYTIAESEYENADYPQVVLLQPDQIDTVRSVKYLGNNTLAVGGDGVVVIYDISGMGTASGSEQIAVLDEMTGQANGMDYSGVNLAVAEDGGSNAVYIYDSNFQLETTLEEANNRVDSVAIEDSVAYGSWDNSLYIHTTRIPQIDNGVVETGDGRTLEGTEYTTQYLNTDTYTVEDDYDSVEWYVNGEFIKETASTFEYTWNETELGENTVTAQVTNEYNNTGNLTWTVTHEDVDSPAIADSYVDIGVYDEIFTDQAIESARRSEDTFAIETGEDVHEVRWYIDGVEVESENVFSTGPFMYTTQWEDAGEYEVMAEVIREEGEGTGVNYVSWDVTVYEILIGGQDSFSQSEGGTFHVTQQFEVFGTDSAEINYTLEYDEDVLRLVSGETTGVVDSGMTRTWEFQVRESGYNGEPITITAEYENVESTKEIHLASQRTGGGAGAAIDDLFDTVLSNTWLEWLVGGFVDLDQRTYIQVQTVLTGGLLSGIWLHHFGMISLPVWTLEQLRPRTKAGLSAIVGAVGIGFILPWILVISVVAGLGWYFWDPIAARFSEVISPI